MPAVNFQKLFVVFSFDVGTFWWSKSYFSSSKTIMGMKSIEISKIIFITFCKGGVYWPKKLGFSTNSDNQIFDQYRGKIVQKIDWSSRKLSKMERNTGFRPKSSFSGVFSHFWKVKVTARGTFLEVMQAGHFFTSKHLKQNIYRRD